MASTGVARAPTTPPQGRAALHEFLAAVDKAGFAVWLAVLGATVYVMLRIVSALFYAPLGIASEDVGLDQTRMLAVAAGSLVLLLPVMGAGIAGGRRLTVSEAGITSSRLATLNGGAWLPFQEGSP